MKSWIPCALASLALGLFGLLGPAAQAGAREAQTPRERWERLSEEEREVMRHRYRELKAMDAEARDELLRQSQGVRQRRDQVEQGLPGPWRERLSELDPTSRRRVVRDHFFERAREMGHRFREQLPDDLLRALEGADPVTRMRLLRQFRDERRERGMDELLGRFATELTISPEEREAWAGLDPEARRHKIMELGRRFIAGRVEALGLPEWISAEDWEELQGQTDRVFLENWRRLDAGPEYRPEFLPPPRGEDGGRAHGFGAGTGEGPPQGPHGGSPGSHPPPGRGTPQLPELRPTVEDWLEFRDLPPEQRRERVAERVRARVLQRLEQLGVLSDEALEHLRGLRGPRFGDAVRDLMHPNRALERPDRGPGRWTPPQRPRQPRR